MHRKLWVACVTRATEDTTVALPNVPVEKTRWEGSETRADAIALVVDSVTTKSECAIVLLVIVNRSIHTLSHLFCSL